MLIRDPITLLVNESMLLDIEKISKTQKKKIKTSLKTMKSQKKTIPIPGKRIICSLGFTRL